MVDGVLLAAAELATRRGEAPTLNAWLDDAIRLKLEHDQRLHALGAFIADYEASHLGTAETSSR